MDEILSSIRQIIADDDAAAVRRPAEETASVTAILKSIEPVPAAPVEEPLTLSSAQIVSAEALASKEGRKDRALDIVKSAGTDED